MVCREYIYICECGLWCMCVCMVCDVCVVCIWCAVCVCSFAVLENEKSWSKGLLEIIIIWQKGKRPCSCQKDISQTHSFYQEPIPVTNKQSLHETVVRAEPWWPQYLLHVLPLNSDTVAAGFHRNFRGEHSNQGRKEGKGGAREWPKSRGFLSGSSVSSPCCGKADERKQERLCTTCPSWSVLAHPLHWVSFVLTWVCLVWLL